jgi:hypothetical protein
VQLNVTNPDFESNLSKTSLQSIVSAIEETVDDEELVDPEEDELRGNQEWDSEEEFEAVENAVELAVAAQGAITQQPNVPVYCTVLCHHKR